MSFTVDSSGLRDLRARLVAARDLIPTTLDDALDAVADFALPELIAATPFDPAPNNGTIPGEEGHLADSYETVAADSGHAEIITQEPIKFGYVTQGTDSPIYPVSARAMWWPDAGTPRTKVNGQLANPFHVPVADTIATDADPIFHAVFDAIWKTL